MIPGGIDLAPTEDTTFYTGATADTRRTCRPPFTSHSAWTRFRGQCQFPLSLLSQRQALARIVIRDFPFGVDRDHSNRPSCIVRALSCSVQRDIIGHYSGLELCEY